MEYPWHQEYDTCGIPRTLEPYPDRPSHFFLDRAAADYPRLFMAQSGLEFPYTEAKEHADRLACALAAMGIEKGDRVGTLLPTSIQFIVADSAISKVGAVHVPSSFLESGESLARKYARCSPRALICLDEYMHLARYLEENTGVEDVMVTSLDDYSGAPGRGSGRSGALRLLDAIDQAGPVPPSIEFDTARDLETVMFTGGTTGVAKGCMLTHRNVVANACQNPVVFGPMRIAFRGNVSVLMGNPFFHSYGHSVMHTMMNQCFNLLLVVDPRDYRTMLELVRRYCPVMHFGVPTQFMRMLEENTGKARFVGISGSAPLPPNVQEGFKQSGEGFIMEGYGLSELTAVSLFNISAIIRAAGGRKMLGFLNRTLFSSWGRTVLNSFARMVGPRVFGRAFFGLVSFFGTISRFSRRVSSIERVATIGVPLPDTEVRVIDVDSKEPLPLSALALEGKEGELLLNGPQRMLGYWPREGTGMDEDGYVHTGDVVRMDRRGYFSIVDRVKDMINVSGYKVYTREIDDILQEHPATEIAAAIGVPDPDRPGSERVVVFVQLSREFEGRVSGEDYVEFLKGKVARYAVPRRVIFIDKMPLTSVYKVNKMALHGLYEEMEGHDRPPGA